MIKDKVKNTIIHNGLIEKGEHIVIGLSGGPDSVCLFHILHRLQEELELDLHAVHINHGLRPGAADEDQRYAENLCSAYGVPCTTFVFDVNRIAKEEGISSEDAGRRVRYQSFTLIAEKIAAQSGAAVKIAVAQNMNDQAETVLMRIIRGTGIDGLCGIEYLRKEKGKGVIIRPLLDVTRTEIERYCAENNLNPQIDLTNLEPIYTRNKIRLQLLPYLNENFNSNVASALNRLSRIAKEDKDYFRGRTEDFIRENASAEQDCVRIPVRALWAEHPAVRHRVMMRVFESIGMSKDITAVHLEQADRLLEESKTSSTTDFTGGFALSISYGTAVFHRKDETSGFDFEYELNLEGITDIFELNAQIGVKILKRFDWPEEEGKEKHDHSVICRLSMDKLALGGCRPVIRTRRPGDYMVPFGMRGRKKIQDLFVDAKIRKEERDRIPLLCLGSEVIWVIGNRISENYKVEDDTESIISLEYSLKL